MPSNRRTPFQPPLFRALGEACRAVIGLRRRAPLAAAGAADLTRRAGLPLHPDCGEQAGRILSGRRGDPLCELSAGLLKRLHLLEKGLSLLYLFHDFLFALELHHIEHGKRLIGHVRTENTGLIKLFRKLILTEPVKRVRLLRADLDIKDRPASLQRHLLPIEADILRRAVLGDHTEHTPDIVELPD